MYTKSFPVNAVGDAEEITTTTHCNKVSIYEGPDPDNIGAWTGPTTAYEIRSEQPNGGPTPEWTYKEIGFSHVFEEKMGARQYLPNQRIALIRTVTGATFFHQYEE